MKKIIFIRHGRAEDADPEISDFERSLTKKGKVISRQMARVLKEKEKNPGLVITSPAFRALETAFIFAGVLGIKPDHVKIDSSLYYRTSMKTFLDLLNIINDDIDVLMLFGHNPAFTEIPDKLSSEGCEFLTKTSAVCVAFKSAKWADVKPGSGKMLYYLKPEK
jgi:phosphohistidine phosphatase